MTSAHNRSFWCFMVLLNLHQHHSLSHKKRLLHAILIFSLSLLGFFPVSERRPSTSHLQSPIYNTHVALFFARFFGPRSWWNQSSALHGCQTAPERHGDFGMSSEAFLGHLKLILQETLVAFGKCKPFGADTAQTGRSSPCNKNPFEILTSWHILNPHRFLASSSCFLGDVVLQEEAQHLQQIIIFLSKLHMEVQNHMFCTDTRTPLNSKKDSEIIYSLLKQY